MGFLTLGTALMPLLFFPETQYTKSTVVNRHKRTMIDNFRFWRVSGGDAPKVRRQAQKTKLTHETASLTRRNFLTALLYPFHYIAHPVVFINTTFFSLYLVTTNYLFVSQIAIPSP
jgi:hypothetical protein